MHHSVARFAQSTIYVGKKGGREVVYLLTQGIKFIRYLMKILHLLGKVGWDQMQPADQSALDLYLGTQT